MLDKSVGGCEPDARQDMSPRGVTPTKALEAGGARNRGPVHSGQSCILVKDILMLTMLMFRCLFLVSLDKETYDLT